MKGITVSVDPKAAAWARRSAGKQGKSLSRFVGELLAEQMEREFDYEVAMQPFFADPPVAFDVDSERPTREEWHDRAGIH